MTDSVHFWWRASLIIIFSMAALGWGIFAWRIARSPEARNRALRAEERAEARMERAEARMGQTRERMGHMRERMHRAAETLRPGPATS
jgi:hypothetical protein